MDKTHVDDIRIQQDLERSVVIEMFHFLSFGESPSNFLSTNAEELCAEIQD